MSSIFQRIFKVAQSEAHATMDKFEDPIKMSEQGVRDLKKSLQASMVSLAQVKSLAISLQKQADDQKKMAAGYERKAMLLLQRLKGGEMEQAEAERLATAALSKKDEALQQAATLSVDQQAQQQMADQLQTKVEELKRQIGKFENEVITLRARARTASSMRKINQQLAGADASGTVAMLEKMKNKVQEEESLAQAYGELSDVGGTIDEDIDKALALPSSTASSDSLAELKKKMGMQA
ncbi:MAG: PspA/IM30 family protein [Armatimonadetes bacterium]|jgi:phage shock protein A|nr:PspA/IM30 family protein [Armatimonadota bacterium]